MRCSTLCASYGAPGGAWVSSHDARSLYKWKTVDWRPTHIQLAHSPRRETWAEGGRRKSVDLAFSQLDFVPGDPMSITE